MIGLVDALAPTGWPTLILVTARVVGVMIVAPVWSMRVIPGNVRMVLALTISLTLVTTAPTVAIGEDVLALPGPLALEFLIGLSIGLTAAMFIHAVSIAGEVVSVQMGLSIAAQLAAAATFSSPGVGTFKNLTALALYFVLGGHLILLSGLAESIRIVPPGSVVDWVAGGRVVIDLTASVFTSAVRVAAPILTAMVLANLALAILSKAVPQLNVLMVAFPITIGLGFIVFAASLPVLATLVGDWVEGLPPRISTVADAFATAQPGR